MRAWWQKPFLPKSSNISRTHFSFSGQKQIYRCHDSFPCTWVFIGSTDIFSESSISKKRNVVFHRKIFPGVACSCADWPTADGSISRFFFSLSNSRPVWAENNSFASQYLKKFSCALQNRSCLGRYKVSISWFTNFSCVLLTSQVIYYACLPIKSVVYGLNSVSL